MYKTFESTVEIEGEVYKTYGLSSDGGIIIEDVTTDSERMEGFIEKLNRCEASAIHIKDLIYDFLE